MSKRNLTGWSEECQSQSPEPAWLADSVGLGAEVTGLVGNSPNCCFLWAQSLAAGVPVLTKGRTKFRGGQGRRSPLLG